MWFGSFELQCTLHYRFEGTTSRKENVKKLADAQTEVAHLTNSQENTGNSETSIEIFTIFSKA